MTNRFLGYFGIPDFHDAVIVDVQETASTTDVVLRAENGRQYHVSFSGGSVLSRSPVGMRIYAISKISGPKPELTTYVFANSDDEESDATLEITASCDPDIALLD